MHGIDALWLRPLPRCLDYRRLLLCAGFAAERGSLADEPAVDPAL